MSLPSQLKVQWCQKPEQPCVHAWTHVGWPTLSLSTSKPRAHCKSQTLIGSGYSGWRTFRTISCVIFPNECQTQAARHIKDGHVGQPTLPISVLPVSSKRLVAQTLRTPHVPTTSLVWVASCVPCKQRRVQHKVYECTDASEVIPICCDMQRWLRHTTQSTSIVY